MDKDKSVFKMLWPDDLHEMEDGTWMFTPASIKGILINTTSIDWRVFGMMWERAQECEWWEAFVKANHGMLQGTVENWPLGKFETTIVNICDQLINPTRFRDALYDFGKAEGLIPKEEG